MSDVEETKPEEVTPPSDTVEAEESQAAVEQSENTAEPAPTESESPAAEDMPETVAEPSPEGKCFGSEASVIYSGASRIAIGNLSFID